MAQQHAIREPTSTSITFFVLSIVLTDHPALVGAFTTKNGLVGQYDYAFLFTPKIPFVKRPRRAAPFFGLNDRMPVLLALLLGLQHALAMLAGIITPPIILSGAANFTSEMQSYLVSTSLIASGILSCIQITRFHIWKTPYFIGTGLIVSAKDKVPREY